MSETKHTPGPWRVEIEPGRPQEPAIVAAEHSPSNSLFIATCHGGLDDDEQVQFANAHLIAAAPDLLEALRDSWQLVAELEDAINENLQLLPPDTERIAKTCEKNRAAIAKATGDAA